MKYRFNIVAYALALCCLISAPHQAYAPVVGYVNLHFPAGQFVLLCNPLDAFPDNSITNLFRETNAPTYYETNFLGYSRGTPDGAVIYQFDANSQTYSEGFTYFTGVGWFPASGNTNEAALALLPPGEGFFFYTPEAMTNTFVGAVRQGSLTNPIPANFSLKSSIVPQSAGIQTTMGFPATTNDMIYFFDGNFWSHAYDASNLTWTPSEPTPLVGQAFFVHRDPVQATEANWWVRNFIVNFAPGLGKQDTKPALVSSASTPQIRSLHLSAEQSILHVSNPTCAPYNVEFSPDGISWKVVATNQTNTVWQQLLPSRERGYYQLSNP